MHQLRKVFRALAAGSVAALLAACQEDLAGGAACPSLCPEQGLEVRDTTVFALSLDSSIVGYPPLGSEAQILIAYRGDTLRTAAIARFDTLLSSLRVGTDTTSRRITSIDSGSVAVQIGTTPLAKARVTIELYDVDTVAADLDTAAVRVLFRSDRFLGSRSFAKDSLTGTLRVPISPSFLTSRITAGRRIRLGLVIKSDSSAQIRILAAEAASGTAPVITYLARATADTQTISVLASSNASVRNGPALAGLADYMVVLAGTPTPPRELLAVGGLPAIRTYLRFALPAVLVDSTTVVRATLLLTQAPSPGVDPTDSLVVLPLLGRARSVLDAEPGKAALVFDNDRQLPPLQIPPNGSGVRQLEIASIIPIWRLEDPAKITRAIVLVLADEGTAGHVAYFYSTDASAESLRPRLKVSYIPRAGFGLP